MNLIDVAFVAFDALGLLVHLPAVVMIAVYVIIKTNRGLVKIWMVAANRLLHLGELLWLVLYHVWHVESLCCWVEKSVLGVVRVEGSAGELEVEVGWDDMPSLSCLWRYSNSALLRASSRSIS